MTAEKSIELAATHISVGISTQGLGKDLVTGIKGVGSQLGAVGKSSGAEFSRGFTAGSKDATKQAEGDLKRLESAVRTQSSKVRAARTVERDATAKLAIEEAKLVELRASGKAKTSQVLAAEDRVEKARRAQVIATEKAGVESSKLADAHLDLKRAQVASADAGHKLSGAIQGVGGAAKQAGTDTERAATGLRGAWQRATGAIRGLNPFSRLPQQADQAATKSAGRLRSGLAAGVKKLGPMIAGGLVGGLAAAGLTGGVDVFKDIVASGSNLEQSIGGVTAVFKQGAGNMLAAAKDADQAVGLSESTYNDMATKLGSMLKNKGIADFGGETKKLIGLGADLAAQFGGPTSEAVDALAALMRGERDPIEKYGISFNEAAVQAEAFSMGLAKPEKNLDKIKAAQNRAIVAQRTYNETVKEHGKNSDEALTAEARLAGANSALAKAMEGSNPKLTDQQKAMASLSLAYKQSKDAQGAFARESDTFAGKQQRAAAQWEKMKEGIGLAFLPALTSAMGFVNDIALPAIKGLADGIGGLVAGFGQPLPAGGLSDGIASVTSAFTGLWDTAEPIFEQIQGYVVDNWPEISRVAGEVWGTVQQIFGVAADAIGYQVRSFTTTLQEVWANWGESVMGIIGDFSKFVWGTFVNLWDILSGVFDLIGGLFTGDTKKMTDGALKIFGGFKNQIGNIFTTIVSILGHVWNGIKKTFAAPINWVISNVLNPLIDKINGVAKALGAGFSIPRINLVISYGGGSSAGRGGGGLAPRAMARGGILGGFRPVHLGDDQWVRMRSGEGVYVSEAMRDPYERKRLVEVNRAALMGRSLAPFQETGDVLGFAGGGIVPNARQGFRGYNPSFLSRIKAWAAATSRTWHMTGNGGARSFNDQMRAWKLYKAGKGPLAANPYKGGPHMIPANAMDLSPRPGQVPAARAALGRFGLGLPVRGEPWHVGWAGGGRKGGGAVTGGAGAGAFVGDSSSELSKAVAGLVHKEGPGPLGDLFGALPELLVGWARTKLKDVLGFDAGGWLEPGQTLAVNATGRPEAVLTAPQWKTVEQLTDVKFLADALEEAVRRGSDGDGVRKLTVFGPVVGDEAIDKLLDGKQDERRRDKDRSGVFG